MSDSLQGSTALRIDHTARDLINLKLNQLTCYIPRPLVLSLPPTPLSSSLLSSTHHHPLYDSSSLSCLPCAEPPPTHPSVLLPMDQHNAPNTPTPTVVHLVRRPLAAVSLLISTGGPSQMVRSQQPQNSKPNHPRPPNRSKTRTFMSRSLFSNKPNQSHLLLKM